MALTKKRWRCRGSAHSLYVLESSDKDFVKVAVLISFLIFVPRFLLKNDGLFVGSSSAMNCVGAVRVAQTLGPGHTIVTILCDSGMRHLSKFHDPKYLDLYGLSPTAIGLEFLGIK